MQRKPSQPHSSLQSTSSREEVGELVEHLDNIEKLLDAAFELMKGNRSVDKATVEQLRQVRVRVRLALSEIRNRSSKTTLPTRPPELWRERLDQYEDPIAFTKRVYMPWIDKGLFRSHIKQLDKPLYEAIYNLTDPGKKLDEIGLLTKKQVNDQKLQAAGALKRPPKNRAIAELPPQERERARLYNLARRREQLSRKQ
jgi:hypothetical protein